ASVITIAARVRQAATGARPCESSVTTGVRLGHSSHSTMPPISVAPQSSATSATKRRRAISAITAVENVRSRAGGSSCANSAFSRSSAFIVGYSQYCEEPRTAPGHMRLHGAQGQAQRLGRLLVAEVARQAQRDTRPL